MYLCDWLHGSYCSHIHVGFIAVYPHTFTASFLSNLRQISASGMYNIMRAITVATTGRFSNIFA